MLELMGMDDVIAGGEKKRGKETGESEVGRVGGGGVEKKEDQGRQAPTAAPGIHLEHHPPPPTLLTSKGHRAPQPYILITKEPPL